METTQQLEERLKRIQSPECNSLHFGNYRTKVGVSHGTVTLTEEQDSELKSIMINTIHQGICDRSDHKYLFLYSMGELLKRMEISKIQQQLTKLSRQELQQTLDINTDHNQ